jgi:hypothetical protein
MFAERLKRCHRGIWICAVLLLPVAVHATEPASGPSATPALSTGAVIKAYKRDPLPLYDGDGQKLRDAARSELPAIGSPSARVVGARPGFVGIMLGGKLMWLRLSTVDYVGDVNAVKCDAMAMKFAKMEEDGVDQSLGLGCAE